MLVTCVPLYMYVHTLVNLSAFYVYLYPSGSAFPFRSISTTLLACSMAWAVKKVPSSFTPPTCWFIFPFLTLGVEVQRCVCKKDVMVDVERHATWQYVPTFYVVVCKAG